VVEELKVVYEIGVIMPGIDASKERVLCGMNHFGDHHRHDVELLSVFGDGMAVELKLYSTPLMGAATVAWASYSHSFVPRSEGEAASNALYERKLSGLSDHGT
jgi:hypothetical protein